MEQVLILSNIQILSLIFVTSVAAAVLNLKTIIGKKSPDSFRSIISGLLIIDCFIVCEILKVNNVFKNIPFLNNTLFFDITYSIGLITGIALLVKGVSTWMPVFKTYKKLNTNTINKLNLFKKIDQLLLVEHRFEILLDSAAELIKQQFRFENYAAYLHSHKNKRFVSLTDTLPESNHYDRVNNDYRLSQSWENKAPSKIETVEYIQNSKPMAKIVVPIILDKKTIGIWVFTTENNFEKDDIDNIKIVADIFAAKADYLNMVQKVGFNNEINIMRDKIIQAVDDGSSLQDNLMTIKELLAEQISFNFLSIYLFEAAKVKKMSVSDDNRFLTTMNQKTYVKNEIENYISETGFDLIINDLENETNFIIDPVLLKADMKSCCAIPLFYNKEIIAVIAVFSESKNKFTPNEAAYLRTAENTITALINSEQQKRKEQVKAGIHKNIMHFNRLAGKINDSKTLFDSAAEFISSLCNAEFVRFSQIEENSRFINSISLVTKGLQKNTPPADAPLLLSLLPHHEQVIKKYTKCSATSSALTDTEKKHIFGNDFDSLYLFPVIKNNKVKIICTIGINDRTNQETYPGQYVEMVEVFIELLTVHAVRVESSQEHIADSNRISVPDRLFSQKDNFSTEKTKYKPEHEYQKIGL